MEFDHELLKDMFLRMFKGEIVEIVLRDDVEEFARLRLLTTVGGLKFRFCTVHKGMEGSGIYFDYDPSEYTRMLLWFHRMWIDITTPMPDKLKLRFYGSSTTEARARMEERKRSLRFESRSKEVVKVA